MTSSRLASALDARILVLDGAMGTSLMDARTTEDGVQLAGPLDVLTLTQPALVRAVHEAYLDAGADIISTNTFCADVPSLAAYGLGERSHEINLAAARLARVCADAATMHTPGRPRFVTGVVGPSRGPGAVLATHTSSSNDAADRQGAVARDTEAYRAQVGGLIEGGVDLLLVETAIDPGNARAALGAIRAECATRQGRLAVMVSTTAAALRRHEGGMHALIETWQTALGEAVLIVGLNCGDGATGLADAVADISRTAPCFTSCHPSAGLPQPDGRYPESPNALASMLGDFARAGWLNVAGGCCGTTPDHVRAIAAAVEGVPPRRVASGRVASGRTALEST